jgi:hypothetical protein
MKFHAKLLANRCVVVLEGHWHSSYITRPDWYRRGRGRRRLAVT